MLKHEHTRGVCGHTPAGKLKFRSPKTAGNAPKSFILLILSLSMGMHRYSGIKNVLLTVHVAKIGSAYTRSHQVLPYSADWHTLARLLHHPWKIREYNLGPTLKLNCSRDSKQGHIGGDKCPQLCTTHSLQEELLL